MKKVICFIAFALVYFGSVAQTFPQNPTNGQVQINNTNLGAGTFNRGVRGGVFVDTSAANDVPYMKGTKFMLISTTSDNNYWYRSADTMRWELIATTTSNCAGTQLISGSITWSGSGLVYDATDLDYYILCSRYFANSTTLTLATADPTYGRIDKFYADNTQNIGVITGTPSANPQEPSVNPLTQIDLGFVYIPAGSTVPAGTTQTVIYNENVEWSGTSNVPSVNFTYGTNPYIGSVSTYLPSAPNSSYVEWQSNGTDYLFSDAQYLKFWVRLNANFVSDPLSFLDVTFEYTDVTVSQTLAVGNGDYNMDYDLINQWQLVSIPLTGITTFGTDFNSVHFVINSAPSSFQLDYVYLLETATVPPVISSGWALNLNTGTNPTTNGIGTSDSVGLAIKTNSQTRLIFPANGIVELSNDELDQQLLTIRNDTIYKTNIPTAYGTLPIVVEVRNDSTFITCPTCDTTGGGGSGWGLEGTAITAGQFLGTTNNEPLVFKFNGNERGIISGTNIAFGSFIKHGVMNAGFGDDALLSTTSNTNYNTALGSISLQVLDNGNDNTAVGYNSLSGITAGKANTAIGAETTLATISSTDSSVAIGYEAVAATRQLAFSPHVTEIKATGIRGASNSGYVLTTNGSGIATFQAASVSSPSGNYGNLQINRNGVFSTPASDSLTFSSATLAVKGALTTTGAITASGIVSGNIGLFTSGVRPNNNTSIYWNSGPAILGNTNDIIFKNATPATAGANVSIGTSAAVASAILDVNSTTKGALLPRMTGAEAEAISSPATGLLIYCTNANGSVITSVGLWNYNGTAWVTAGAKPYKVLTGNLTQTGTSAPTFTIFENTTGTTITATRGSAGVYTLTSSGTPFTANKTQVFLNNGVNNIYSSVYSVATQVTNTSTIGITIWDVSTFLQSDDILTNASIEIRIYP